MFIEMIEMNGRLSYTFPQGFGTESVYACKRFYRRQSSTKNLGISCTLFVSTGCFSTNDVIVTIDSGKKSPHCRRLSDCLGDQVISTENNSWSQLKWINWWVIRPIQNGAKNLEKRMKPWHMGTHLRVLTESYPMNTNMTRFRRFAKIFVSLRLDKGSLSIGRVKCLRKDLCLLFLKVS